jgi:hypothetical protein
LLLVEKRREFGGAFAAPSFEGETRPPQLHHHELGIRLDVFEEQDSQRAVGCGAEVGSALRDFEVGREETGRKRRPCGATWLRQPP